MTEQIGFDWDALDRLIPLCLDFYQQHKKGETVDLHDAACKIGQAFEIDDIDEFAKERIKETLHVDWRLKVSSPILF